jgi:hypothetical protein
MGITRCRRSRRDALICIQHFDVILAARVADGAVKHLPVSTASGGIAGIRQCRCFWFTMHSGTMTAANQMSRRPCGGRRAAEQHYAGPRRRADRQIAPVGQEPCLMPAAAARSAPQDRRFGHV